jgi:hypothetical protein
MYFKEMLTDEQLEFAENCFQHSCATCKVHSVTCQEDLAACAIAERAERKRLERELAISKKLECDSCKPEATDE